MVNAPNLVYIHDITSIPQLVDALNSAVKDAYTASLRKLAKALESLRDNTDAAFKNYLYPIPMVPTRYRRLNILLQASNFMFVGPKKVQAQEALNVMIECENSLPALKEAIQNLRVCLHNEDDQGLVYWDNFRLPEVAPAVDLLHKILAENMYPRKTAVHEHRLYQAFTDLESLVGNGAKMVHFSP